jgi:hypothetical protein
VVALPQAMCPARRLLYPRCLKQPARACRRQSRGGRGGVWLGRRRVNLVSLYKYVESVWREGARSGRLGGVPWQMVPRGAMMACLVVGPLLVCLNRRFLVQLNGTEIDWAFVFNLRAVAASLGNASRRAKHRRAWAGGVACRGHWLAECAAIWGLSGRVYEEIIIVERTSGGTFCWRAGREQRGGLRGRKNTLSKKDAMRHESRSKARAGVVLIRGRGCLRRKFSE